MRHHSSYALFAALAPLVLLACSSKEEAAPAADSGVTEAAVDAAVDTLVAPDTAPVDAKPEAFPDPFTGCTKDPGPGTVTVAETETGDDPTGGAEKFTLAMAMQGYPSTATGALKAAITTELGIIVCTLDEAKAPISVANFVGLSRGTRPFLDNATGKWVARRFYDGLKWHRVIFDFMIQGGDPRGTGSGGPGYDLVDENHVKEPAGTLAMAASSTPSGSQFFIVTGTGPAPDYNVFGACDLTAATAISAVETNTKDAPKTPVHMTRIDIARCP